MGNQTIKFIFAATLAFGFSQNAAEARGYSGGSSGEGWAFNTGLMYLYAQTTEAGSTVSSSQYLADVNLGYHFSGGPFFLGGNYSYDSTSTTSNSVSVNDTYSSFGPTVGLISDSVYFLLTYFAVSSETKPSTTYSPGSGFQATLGYKFDLGSNWGLAPELSYKNLAYTQVSTGGASVTSDRKHSTLLPLVALWYTF